MGLFWRNQALIPFFLLLLISGLKADSDRFRLTLNGDPATSMTIGWDAVSGSQHRVYFDTTDHGTDTTLYSSVRYPDAQYSHKGMNNTFARLSGLRPDTRYYFVVADDQGVSQRYWFETLPDDPDKPLYFIAGGDSRNNRNVRQNANELVGKLMADAVFFGGDMTLLSTSGQWQDWLDDWQMSISQSGRITPIVPARGNHELSNDAVHYLFDTDSDVSYAHTFGGKLFRIYTLNTEASILGSQTTWLQNDLNANSNVIWKGAQYHRPMRPHVGSKGENNTAYSAWADLFYQHGVRLVVECDAHACKSTWPVEPSTGTGSEEGFRIDSTSGQGTVYTGEGCWGAPIRNNDDDKSWTRNSGKFNQFKWIRVDRARIRMRTVKVDNASMVGSVDPSHRFLAPDGLEIWEPSNGAEVVIENPNETPPRMDIIAPQSGSHFDVPQQFMLEVDAWDPNGEVDSVMVFQDGVLKGKDSVPPYQFDLLPSQEGLYEYKLQAFDNDGIMTEKSLSLIFGDETVRHSVMIGDANDDAEEAAGGGVDFTSSDIELVNDLWTGSGDQTVGLRFSEFKVPQGAQVDSAFVQFTTDSDNSGSSFLWVKAEASDNSAPFSNSSTAISSRSVVNDSVSWSPPDWTVSGARTNAQRTPDIGAVVQEVTDRSGWRSGNALSVIVTGTGVRTAVSYDNASDHPAELIAYYSLPVSSTEVPPQVDLLNPPDGASAAPGQSFDLQANASDADGNVQQVEFLVNGNLVGSDATAPYEGSWTASNSGYKEVQARATDDDGNSTITSIHLLEIGKNTSMRERAWKRAFRVNPNPFEEEVRVQLPPGDERKLRLYSASGRLLKSYSPAKGERRMELAFPQLSSGLYYMVLEDGEKRAVRKMVK